MTRDLPVSPAGYEAEGVVSPDCICTTKGGPEGCGLCNETGGRGSPIPDADGWTPHDGGPNPAGALRIDVWFKGQPDPALTRYEPANGWTSEQWSRIAKWRPSGFRPDRLVSAEPDRAEGEGLRDELDDWIVRGIQAADRTVTGIGPIKASTPEDIAAGRVAAYQVGFQNGVKSTLTDACYIMARHPSPPTPACEGKGVTIPRWTAELAQQVITAFAPDERNVLDALQAALSSSPSQEQAGAVARPLDAKCACFRDTGLQASTYHDADDTERCDFCGGVVLSHTGGMVAPVEVAWLKRLIEEQADNYACGTQDRRFLRDDDNHETPEREMLRLNLEQFAKRLAARVSHPQQQGAVEVARKALEGIRAWINREVPAGTQSATYWVQQIDAVLLPAGAAAMTVIDPDQWSACSPTWLQEHPNACGAAPRVWCESEHNHYHPKNWPTQKADPLAMLERWGENWIAGKGQLTDAEPPCGVQLMVGENVVAEGEGETFLAAVKAALSTSAKEAGQ